MKPGLILIVTLASIISPNGIRSALAQAPESVVIQRGPHHALHHWTTEHLWPDGQNRSEDHYVTELATGLNYFKEGQWAPSHEGIELFQDGAVARQGQFQVIFGPNANEEGAVDLLTQTGQRFRSRIMGLVYLDTMSGDSVLIAELKDSAGQVLPPNQVFYLDAFDGVDALEADVRYTCKKGSFEQDIILRTRPRPPSHYGLSDAFSRLEVWTEFFEAPVPVKQAVVLRAETDPVRRQIMAVPDFMDHRLWFDQAEIGTGKAFLVADDSEATLPVAKDWVTIQEPNSPPRTFLIESVEFSAIAPWLNSLPGGQAALQPANGPSALLARKPVSNRTALIAQARPVPLKAADPSRTRPFKVNPQLAALNQKPGVVLDYITLNSSQTNYTFKADMTYNISAPVTLYGANYLEGGTVIKFAQGAGATLHVKGTLVADTDTYRPAVLTASADSTVGEALGGSLSGYYANPALEFDYVTSSQLATQQNLRILYAVVGVRFNGGSGHELRHLQLVNCGTAVKADNARYAVRNALGWNLTNALIGSTSTGAWEHATFNGVTNLVTSITGLFTNCLLTAVVSTSGLAGESNIVLSSAGGVFKTVGSGYHYLTNGSPYRDLGTTNINPVLATELRNRTTYPPLVLSSISADTTLTPQASRDTDLPDVGWHYSPLDYLASGVTVSSNVTLSLNNGVAVGMDYTSSSWGFDLRNARFHSTGLAEQFNYVGRAHTAQEKSGGNPGTRACFYDGSSSSGSRECALRLRFTEFSQLQNDGYLVYVGTKFGALEWTHSRIFNPSLALDTSGNGVLLCGLTNSLWERGNVLFGLGTTGTNVTVQMRNNLARNLSGWAFLRGSNSWTIHDNLFESVGILTNYGSVVQNWTNAYYNTFWGLSSGVGNILMGSLTYETGPLGKFYQPSNSALTNAGTRTADLAQLFHFTTATNQVKETNSIVDIGLHYAAVNSSGLPIDTDSDGTPDYLEDGDGDGAVDNGETNWQDALDWGLRVFITRPRNGSNIP